jgi:hypothetical protein
VKIKKTKRTEGKLKKSDEVFGYSGKILDRKNILTENKTLAKKKRRSKHSPKNANNRPKTPTIAKKRKGDR